MDCLRNYDVKDNRITELSRAYRIKLGTGWYTPAGVIHAPASVVHSNLSGTVMLTRSWKM